MVSKLVDLPSASDLEGRLVVLPSASDLVGKLVVLPSAFDLVGRLVVLPFSQVGKLVVPFVKMVEPVMLV